MRDGLVLWSGPIVDAHQHFWEPGINHHPWLEPDAHIPFRYGDYSSIKRRYLPDDLRADAGGLNIAETVYVETEWDPADPIGETRYASGIAARFGWPNAIVAQAWLDRADAAETLAAQAAFPLVRSVRHKPGGGTAPEAVPSLMSDDRWRRGYGELARHGLHFDLQTPWWQLEEAGRLARDFPRTMVILNHAGLPSQRDPASLADWHAAMGRFAEHPNVAVKISGLGQPGVRWTVAANEWIVREIIAMFGAGRAMFASNFPVDSLCGSYRDIMDGFREIAARLPLEDQEALFCGTARRIYRTGG